MFTLRAGAPEAVECTLLLSTVFNITSHPSPGPRLAYSITLPHCDELDGPSLSWTFLYETQRKCFLPEFEPMRFGITPLFSWTFLYETQRKCFLPEFEPRRFGITFRH